MNFVGFFGRWTCLNPQHKVGWVEFLSKSSIDGLLQHARSTYKKWNEPHGSISWISLTLHQRLTNSYNYETHMSQHAKSSCYTV